MELELPSYSLSIIHPSLATRKYMVTQMTLRGLWNMSFLFCLNNSFDVYNCLFGCDNVVTVSQKSEYPLLVLYTSHFCLYIFNMMSH